LLQNGHQNTSTHSSPTTLAQKGIPSTDFHVNHQTLGLLILELSNENFAVHITDGTC